MDIAIAYMGAGIGFGLTVIGAGIGIGRLAAAIAEGVARQPSASGQITIANSTGKVSGDAVTGNGARITFNVKSDGSVVTGDLTLTTGTRTVLVRSWLGFGISSDRKTAVLYGRTAAGDEVVAELTDASEPGRGDRAIVRFNGATLTDAGSLIEGNIQIHK